MVRVAAESPEDAETVDVVDHGGLRRVREEIIREARAALYSRVWSKWAKKDIQKQTGPLSLSSRIDDEEGPLDEEEDAGPSERGLS